ncbi:putative permease [Candidatus Bilamarchaeum dharawalense]|uniref:Putative permease n=1 Tax=Candidatus Bilamarchaeum dharawalense TaxID=2885759 RepID=A0A5E4LRT5_9ARCH|nr:putative permease [Candidatus Bilamarchaeum dharawalense]
MDIFEQIGSFVVLQILRMSEDDALTEVVAYFIADTIKVLVLLTIMVFLVSIIRTFITRQRIRKFLGGKKEGVGNILAALLGIPTPFCSCSAVPIFIGFVESGIPLGVTFSFLIASPMINEIAIALLLSLFGWQVAALYIGAGLVVAIVAGIIIGRMNLEGDVEDFVHQMEVKNKKEKRMKWTERINFAKEQTWNIVCKVTPYLILGIGLGALIHGYVPIGFLADIAGKNNPLAVPMAVLIGVPLYSNAAGVIPIVQALMEKGMSMGTALAFMMSVTALSLPEMIILRKVLKPKLLAIFVIILAVSITLVGLMFNFILG